MKCLMCGKEFKAGMDMWVCPECDKSVITLQPVRECENINAPVNEWVRIDTLPETIPDNCFFITLSGDEPAIAIFRDGKFYFKDIDNCKYPIQNVSHWMMVKLPDNKS